MSAAAFLPVHTTRFIPTTKLIPAVRILRLWLTDVRVNTNWLVGWQLAFLFLICLTGNPLLAQDPNNNYCLNSLGADAGGFSLDKQKTCVGTPVLITGTSPNLGNVGYFDRYDGKGIPNNTTQGPSFVYTQPGSYTIIQVGSRNGTRSIACREVTVLPLEPVKFTVNRCSDRTATIVPDAASLGQYDNYTIDWGDGVRVSVDRARLAASISHPYTNNGPYVISIVGSYGGVMGCVTPANAVRQNAQVVTFTTTSQPVITRLTTVNDNTITIQYQASAGTSVELLQKDANGIFAQTYQKGTGSGVFTVVTNAKQPVCFRLATIDACNTAGAQSSDVCSLVLDAKAVNKQNDLSWQPYAGAVTGNQFRFYRILRNGTPLGPTITNRTTGSYADNNKIDCGAPYCYSLEATINGTAQTIVTSAPICVTGVNGDAPGDFRNVVVSVEDGRPRIIATLPTSGTSTSYTLVVSRSDGSGTFQPVGTAVNKNTFVDETANPSAGSHCYQLTYQSNCGLASDPSSPVCTIFLDSKSSVGIDWTADSPFLTGPAVNYTVEVIDSLNGTRQEINLGSNTHYEPDPNDPNLQSQKYRIIAVSSGGVPSYSNFYTLRRESRLVAPDAFTPNGDGINDTFVAGGIYVDQFRMTIYDRWGKVIYSTTDRKEGWDGTANGQPALAGQYMYRLEVTDLTGLKTVRTGGLLLIR